MKYKLVDGSKTPIVGAPLEPGKVYAVDNALMDDMKSTIKDFAHKTSEIVVKQLQFYRSLCSSDEEFSCRMTRHRDEYDLYKEYYKFDGNIVFRTELIYENSAVKFRLILSRT